MSMQKWEKDTTPHQDRRIGKTIEELGELMAVLGRIGIQGLDAIDPSSGKTNRLRMQEESADVLAQLNCNFSPFGMDSKLIIERTAEKVLKMDEWEAHYMAAPEPAMTDCPHGVPHRWPCGECDA